MMTASNNYHSYRLWERIIRDWLYDNDWKDLDTYDLKVDIKSTVMDWLENYISNWWYDDELYEAEELDNTNSDWVRSSIEDALNDWCDENLFK